jgi:hypothetical protein
MAFVRNRRVSNRMPSTFMGSEPAHAEVGKYAGTHLFQDEERNGRGLIWALTPAQLITSRYRSAQPRRPV